MTIQDIQDLLSDTHYSTAVRTTQKYKNSVLVQTTYVPTGQKWWIVFTDGAMGTAHTTLAEAKLFAD